MALRRTLALILTIMAFAVFLGGFSEEAHAKVKLKQPKITYCKVDRRNAVTIKWSSVKGAKEFLVYCKKDNGKWKQCAHTRKNDKWEPFRKRVKYDYNLGHKFYYKVRAINGKSKSKFSKVVKIYKKSKYPDIKEGKTMNLVIDGYDLEKCTITKKDESLERLYLEFTKNGKKGMLDAYGGKLNNVDIGSHGDWARNSLVCTMMDLFIPTENYTVPLIGTYKKDVKIYWTLDGTKPEVGQEDLYGPLEGIFAGQNNQLRGTVTEDICHYSDINGEHYADIMREEKADPMGTCMVWAKAYRDGKYIDEYILRVGNMRSLS